MSIHVQLERFEGPLGLLLHLIREQEMDIFNINIHEITRQYLEYIKAMRRLDLEVAGEFVAMAATLLHIKSRMLLPQYNEEGEEVVSEDPRKELVQKLIEYKKIRELSVDLYKRPLLGRDVFARGERTEIESMEESELVLEENPLFSLIAAYRTALKNMKKTVHRVLGELQSIAARIMEMKDLFVVGKRVVFKDLITAKENVGSQVLVTFLSLLELAKMGFISVFQTEPFADIHIEAKKPIDTAAVSRAENYDSVNAESNADAIMAKAQLTLDEPVDALEGEEAPVVQESFAESASDEEIFAEEQRLFAAEEATASAEAVAEAATEVGAENAVEASAEAVAEQPILAVEPSVPADSVLDEAPIAELEQALAADVNLQAVEALNAAPEPQVASEPGFVAADEPVLLETIELPPTAEPVEAAVPAPAPISDIAFLTAPEPGEDIVKEKLNNALSAAKSAFDAFNDEPEVES